MRLVLALVGTLVLCTSGSPAPLDDKAAWREACRVSGYSCFGITPPMVARAPLPDGLLGRYKIRDKYILVSEGLDDVLEYVVTVHEMTHYLQWQHHKWRRGKHASCERERDAFDASNTTAARLGKPELLVDWDTRRLVYGCPL